MSDDEATQHAANGMLAICGGGLAGTEYALKAEETILGRSPNADVEILDESVSREHALILFDADTGRFVIEDLQSTNGTKVNGKRCRSVELADGDEIEIGHTCFKFRNLEPLGNS